NGFDPNALQRAIDRHQNLLCSELVKAATEAREVTLAAELLTWKARLRILHHPYVAALLDAAGRIPRPLKAPHRPGADQAPAGRAIERYSRAAGRCGRVGRGRIRPHVPPRAPEQGCKLGPAEPHPPHGRCGTIPNPVEIGALRRVRAFGC